MCVNNKMAALLIRKISNQSLGYLNDFPSFRLLLRNFALPASEPQYFCFNDGFEESEKLKELEPYLKRLKYERHHWDNAIKGYRETEKMKWNPANLEIIDRVKKLAFDDNSVPLKHVHVLDLEANGVIMPHIDSIKFCGTTIAGISLLSDSVMRLVHDKNKSKIVDVLLKRFSLYIMTGYARYDFTHEILGNENSKFNDQTVEKSRRISIICRNEP